MRRRYSPINSRGTSTISIRSSCSVSSFRSRTIAINRQHVSGDEPRSGPPASVDKKQRSVPIRRIPAVNSSIGIWPHASCNASVHFSTKPPRRANSCCYSIVAWLMIKSGCPITRRPPTFPSRKPRATFSASPDEI